jgi:hypothetical protein
MREVMGLQGYYNGEGRKDLNTKDTKGTTEEGRREEIIKHEWDELTNGKDKHIGHNPENTRGRRYMKVIWQGRDLSPPVLGRRIQPAGAAFVPRIEKKRIGGTGERGEKRFKHEWHERDEWTNGEGGMEKINHDGHEGTRRVRQEENRERGKGWGGQWTMDHGPWVFVPRNNRGTISRRREDFCALFFGIRKNECGTNACRTRPSPMAGGR